MTGYTRKDTTNNIADGNIVNASDLDNEFDGVVAAFNASTGHTHGGAVGEGAPILTIGPTQDVTASATLLAPKTTNTVDIGSTSLKFKDLYIAGAGSIGGALSVTGATTLSSALTYGGVTLSNAVTGTGNMVLSNSPTLVTPALGTPSSGTVTNLTGTASININGTVGATTASTGAFTTLTTSSTVTHNGGTANGVAYLNGSKVLTTGSALTFDGTVLLSGAGGTGTSSSILKLSGSNASNYGSYLQFLRNSVPTWSIGNDSAINGGSSDDLTIYGTASQRFYASGSEQMRLTSTGLGLGTSSPVQKLDVYGNINGSVVALLRNADTTTSNYATQTYLRLDIAGVVVGGLKTTAKPLAGLSTPALYLTTQGNYPIAFGLNDSATPSMLLDTAGNLGLGVTPSAWNSGYKALQIANNYSSISTQIGGAGTLQMTWGAYATGADTWAYSTTGDTVCQYIMNSGQHRWRTAASGAAGSAITFTQAMTLDASGKLLVGTASAVASNGRVLIYGSSGNALVVRTPSDTIVYETTQASGTSYYGYFIYNGSNVGSITSTGTITTYNTTSDYRLKTVLGNVTGFGERIDALKPVEYEWKLDGSRTHGFLAHQFQEVYAGSVTGSKDAVNAEGKPIYQAMQAGSAEVIADLVAEIQSLRKRLAAAGI